MEIVEQLLIDFNPTNLNNRCRNGQDYDNENLMNIRLEPNQNVNDLEKNNILALFLKQLLALLPQSPNYDIATNTIQYNEQTNLGGNR